MPSAKPKSQRSLRAELKRVKARLAESEATIKAIQSGDVDAVVVDGPNGSRIFTLQSPEDPYRILAERMNEGAATMTAEGTLLFCNRRLAEMVGLSPERLLGSSFPALLREQDRPAVAELLRSATNNDIRADSYLLRPDGSALPVQFSLSSIPLESGQGICLVATDLCERKRAEAVREHLARVVEFSDDAIISEDLNGTITAWNRGAEKIFGYSASEAVGKTVWMIMPPERASEEIEILARIRRGESVEHFETARVRKDGKEIDVSATISPIMDNRGVIVGASKIARDITEGIRAREALRQSDARRGFALDTAKIGDWDLDLTTLKATRSLLHDQIFGYQSPLPEWSFDIFLRHVHPDERERVQETFQSSVSQRKKWEFECRIVCPNGDARWIWACGDQNRDSSGKATRMFGIVQDITERKQAEEVLHEQSRVMDSAQVFVRDMESRVVFWPRGAEKLYGFTSQEALGILSHDLFHTEFPEPLAQIEKTLFDIGMWEGELIHRKRDGSTIVVTSAWALHRNSQGRPIRVLETNVDISARKQAEELLTAQGEELSRQSDELLRSQQVLETQSRMLQLVLDSVGEGLIAADREGHFLIWNDCAKKMMGRDAADLPSEQWTGYYKVFLPDGVTAYPPECLPLVRALHGESVQVELIVEQPDSCGGVCLEVTARPMKDAGGSLCGGVAVLHDITERKRIEAALARQAVELLGSQQALETQTLMLQSVLDSIGEGLVAADETGKFILWNPAAMRIVGMGAANVPPDKWTDHYGTYLPDTVTPFPPEQNPLLRAIHGEACTSEMYIRNAELETGAWIESSGSPLKGKDGAVRGGVVAFRDITQRKKDEHKIRQLNEELEERVVQRTAQLEAANHELEAFTYSVSHDLRAPLRHIGGFSRILVEDFGAGMEPTARRHLQRIEEGTQRMGLLVDELLNLARLGRHALKLQMVGLNSVVEEVVSLLQPETEGRAVSWKTAELPRLQCDPVLVKQVFQNLIANALKFTRTRERAVIEIDHRQENGETVILVRDNGVGFNMKYTDKLFGVFQRLHRAEEFEGTGIGLATVKRIIEKHGGRVWAEAELDRGATFYFSLGAESTDRKTREDRNNAAVTGVQG